jgi:hypothetical protein
MTITLVTAAEATAVKSAMASDKAVTTLIILILVIALCLSFVEPIHPSPF